jgi:hypothetical protein
LLPVNVQSKQATWEEVLSCARSLEQAAQTESVAPADGARLVRLVMAFHSAMSVRVQRPPALRPETE